MDLVTGRPIGVEALVRWQHPDHGLLSPGHFIRVADNYGLAVPLGTWVINQACRMAVLLERRGTPLTVAVNVSGTQLSDDRLVATVENALEAYGCTADRLVFEVTETALVTDMSSAVRSLNKLQQLGAEVSLDDFGTGYAPFMYLKQFSANHLKIDKSFIDGLCGSVCDQAIVGSLITLAHELGMRCVAEGIEKPDQLALLRRMGCDVGQGYHFRRPTDGASFVAWLDSLPLPPVALLPSQPTVGIDGPRSAAVATPVTSC